MPGSDQIREQNKGHTSCLRGGCVVAGKREADLNDEAPVCVENYKWGRGEKKRQRADTSKKTLED